MLITLVMNGSNTASKLSLPDGVQVRELNFTAERGYKITLIELASYGIEGVDGVIDSVFEGCSTKPTVLVDTLTAPEAGHLINRANEFGLQVADFTIPALSIVLARYAKLTPLDLVRLNVCQMVFDSAGSDELAQIKAHALQVNLHVAVVQAIVAQCKLEVATNRMAFSDSIGQIAEKLLSTTEQLNWYRLLGLKLQGDVVALFGSHSARIFDAEFEPALPLSIPEIRYVSHELAEQRACMQSGIISRSKEDSILFLHGREDLFKIDRLADAINSGLLEERTIERIRDEIAAFIADNHFIEAAKRAAALVQGGFDMKTTLLDALTKEFELLSHHKHFPLAVCVAEIMRDLGCEQGAELVKIAGQQHWSAFGK